MSSVFVSTFRDLAGAGALDKSTAVFKTDEQTGLKLGGRDEGPLSALSARRQTGRRVEK